MICGSRLQQIAHTVKFTTLANMITLKRSFIVQSQTLVIAYTRPQVRIVSSYFTGHYNIKRNTTMNVNRSQNHGPMLHYITQAKSSLLYFAQDEQVAHLMRNNCTRKFYAQYLRKILSQCAIYGEDLGKIVLISPLHKICAKFYLFPQCAIHAQDCACFPNAQYMLKIVLVSQMRNICARFAQDCTSLHNVQYMHKIAGIIGRNLSRITYLS